MKYLLLALMSTGLVACGTSKTKLSSDGKQVKVLHKKKRNCNVLAKVVGENDQGSVALAKNHARNLAGNEGADAITFDQIVSNGKEYRVHGTALQCRM